MENDKQVPTIFEQYEKALDEWYNNYKKPPFRYLLFSKEFQWRLALTEGGFISLMVQLLPYNIESIYLDIWRALPVIASGLAFTIGLFNTIFIIVDWFDFSPYIAYDQKAYFKSSISGFTILSPIPNDIPTLIVPEGTKPQAPLLENRISKKKKKNKDIVYENLYGNVGIDEPSKDLSVLVKDALSKHETV